MKTGFSVFIAVFVAMCFSWSGFVLGPVRQLGTEGQTNILNSSDIYPNQRPGAATLGLQVYRAYGCAQCHTTQVGQDGVICNVVLTAAGTKSAAVSNLISTLKLTGLTKDEADAVSGQITAAGGKTETHIVATGADISRGWGPRHSVAEDFLWDNPAQLGSVRVGPDLANIGARYNADWEFMHLYNPGSEVKNSIMPPFRFLFKKEKIDGTLSSDALPLQGELAPPAGYEVVPTDDAKNLVAYLLSLRMDVPLYDAPFSTLAPPAAAKKK
ncbi:MAG TPA: cbb3-type cytochrome c oxidase subunit II [Candidatus Acidoferrales bacterium]|nr:cbb3-type cytochrome c oxidase subunit II [Candidatus Acidoferrales bacterium]